MCKKQSVSGVLILETIVPIDADLGIYAGLAKESSVEIHRESPATTRELDSKEGLGNPSIEF